MAFRSGNSKSLREQRERQRARAKRAALRALQRARVAASESGAELSSWETTFLGSVEERVGTYACAVRKDRHGPPQDSMQIEVVPTWHLDSHDALIFVMAAGVNYNGVWAGLGAPISPIDVHGSPYHIAGSDAAGIVWAVGSKVKRWKIGDEVVVHCNQDDGYDEECNGCDP